MAAIALSNSITGVEIASRPATGGAVWQFLQVALNYVRPTTDGVRARSARRSAVRVRGGGLSRASVGRGGRVARGQGTALHPARATPAARFCGSAIPRNSTTRTSRTSRRQGPNRPRSLPPTSSPALPLPHAFFPPAPPNVQVFRPRRRSTPPSADLEPRCGLHETSCYRPSQHRIPRRGVACPEDLDCVRESRSRTIRRFGTASVAERSSV